MHYVTTYYAVVGSIEDNSLQVGIDFFASVENHKYVYILWDVVADMKEEDFTHMKIGTMRFNSKNAAIEAAQKYLLDLFPNFMKKDIKW